MSEIFDSLRRSGGKIDSRIPDALEVKDMEISDIKKRILDRLKEKKDTASVIAEPRPLNMGREDMLEAIRKTTDAREPVKCVMEKTDGELARQCEELKAELKSALLGRDETAKLLKALRLEAGMKEKLIKELEEAKKLNGEYRSRLVSAQDEVKRLSMTHDGASPRGGKDELSGKDAFMQDLQKKSAAEISEITKDRDRIASNVELLRSKLYAATKETKEQITKIAQLEETVRGKEKRILELDKLQADSATARSGVESRLRASENDNKNLTDKCAMLTEEIKAGQTGMGQLETRVKELDEACASASLQLQAGLRDRKEFEAKIRQINLDLGARAIRLTEADKIYKEMDALTRELTSKLQMSQLRTKELEASNEDLTLRIANEERARKEFESRISELRLEDEAKAVRIEAAEKMRQEQESLIRDTATKLQENQHRLGELEKEAALLRESLKDTPLKMKKAEENAKLEIGSLGAEISSLKNVIRQKEKNEIELRSSIEQLEVEMQARDSKIEGDLKYTEKIVKEIGELRKKLAVLERQGERTKSAGA